MLSFRKLISIIMVVPFCALPAQLTVVASKTSEPVVILENIAGNAKHINTNATATTTATVGAESYQPFSYYGTGAYNYYDQIGNRPRSIYNALKQMPMGQTTISVNVGTITTAPSIKTNIATIVEMGVCTLFKDYPEIFWLSGSYSYSASGYPGSSYYTDVKITMTFELDADYPTPAATKQQLANAVAAVDIPYGTRYDILLALNNFLCGQASYAETSMAHEATGALLEPYTAVCEGYAEAFKLLCDKYKIPCALIVGTGVVSESLSGAHMWNYVKLEDGIWYAVDVTWDDQPLPYHNNYFLHGGDTLPSSDFYQIPFISSHVPSPYFSYEEYHMFTYPTLSASAFAFPSGFYLSSDAAIDDALNELTAGGVFTIRYGGTAKTLTPTSYGTGTGSTFTAPTGTGGAVET